MLLSSNAILPSNVAPSPNDENVQNDPVPSGDSPSNQLHTTSDNSRQIELGYSVPQSNEPLYPQYDFQRSARPSIQSSGLPSHPWRRSTPRPSQRSSEARWSEEYQKLYALAKRCEGFRGYRERQSKVKPSKADKQDVWPEALEDAFFYALVKYEPMGRGKVDHKGQSCGRNMLIAHHIRDTTGVERNRKQVSSHVQQLKPYFAHDPRIMKYFCEDRKGKKTRLQALGTCSSEARARSRHAVDTTLLSKLRAVLGRYKRHLDIFKPVDFQMFVQRKISMSADQEILERLHTYSRSIAEPLGPDMHIADWQKFSDDYPLLANMASRQIPDCNIVLAEASLGLPLQSWKDRGGNAGGVEIGISFHCATERLHDPSIQIKTRNSFFKDGIYLDGLDCDRENDHCLQRIGHVNGLHTWLNFGSKFWAKTLAALDQRLSEHCENLTMLREDIAAHIRGIVMLQEVFVVNQHILERVLVLHWNFRLSSGLEGRASWRKIILPRKEMRGSRQAVDIKPNDSIHIQQLVNTDAPVKSDQTSQPLLRSPFEYEGSSGSALLSAPWPTSISNGSFFPNGSSIAPEAHFNFGTSDVNRNATYYPYLSFENMDDTHVTFAGQPPDFVAGVDSEAYQRIWPREYNAINEDQHFGVEASQYDESFHVGGEALDGVAYEVPADEQVYNGTHKLQPFDSAGKDLEKID